ncbi:MAG TPA: AAA family ATPase [Candidatus Poseidoniales archaeon]|nr:AAA family ATPase [Candidatus Poseidoniales archaeon]
MKTCPVCQYEDEQDSEVSCAICGSDLESSAPADEVPTETEEVIETIEEPSVSDEEKLLEETLAATEVDDSGSTEEPPSAMSVSAFIKGQWSNFGSNFKRFNSKLDSIFLTKGELNYVAPTAMLITSILLFFSVMGLAVSTVPTVTEISSNDALPTTPYFKSNESGIDVIIGRGTSEPYSGDPFNCEIWDYERYEEFGVVGDEGYYIAVTDSNGNGIVDGDERYGCPVNMGYISGFTFFALNFILLVSAFYIYSRISNTSIANPILVFGIAEFLLFVVYGGIANKLIFAIPLTIGLVCTVGLIVSTGVLLVRTSLGWPLDAPPSATFYIFIIAAALLVSSVFYNYSLGPYSICVNEFSAEDLQYLEENVPLEYPTECEQIGFENYSTLPLFMKGGDNIILLMAATFLFAGVGNWLISNTKINDVVEAKYFSMILSGLLLQFLILAYNVVTSEDGGLGMDENDTTLTVMALGITTVGMVSFYRKRSGEPGSMGVAYFAIFAVGIFALFATFLAPIVIGGNDVEWPRDRDEQFNLVLAALVTAIGFWLSYKFGSQKLRQMSAAYDAAMPNREDPFAPTSPGEQKAMPEWSVDSAMEFLMDEYGDEFQIELKHSTEHTPDLELVEKTMMDKVDQSATIREAIEIDYEVDFNKIAEAYSTTRETIDEVLTHLTSGKNIMLFGEPGTGKTALANILLTQLCGEIEQPNGSKIPNYSIVTANAEWSNFDVIGGISPDDSGGYYFKDGYVAEAAKLCELSILKRGKPHYLVIDEFNRANIDEAFGKLFTVFEYRDKQPLLTHKETGGAPFMMPPEFRIIGTMNTQDKNTLFNIGFALMRRFAFVEIGLPDPDDEYHRMPVFVYFKLKKLGLVPERADGDELWKFGEKCRHYPSRKFDFYDEDGNMYKCHEKLVEFLAPDEPPKRGDEIAVGVRTFRKIGPAMIIDSMVTIFNSVKKYGPELALDRAIRSTIMPSMEGLERNEIRCVYLKAKEVLGPNSLVTETLDRMANSDSLSIF